MTDAVINVDHLFPLREPWPEPDCAECQRLADARATARKQFDRSKVSDCNVLLRRHQSGAHQDVL